MFELLKKILPTSIISESMKFFGKEVLKESYLNVFKDFTLYPKRKMSLP